MAQLPQKPFVPASNRKIFTGALVLDQLGPDYRYTSTLYRTGTVSGGVLNGNLVVQPSGDPSMNSELFPGQGGDWVLQNWASRVRAAGIQQVNGGLIVDVSKWDMRDLQPRGWAARILDDHYAPRTGPFNVNSNLVTVRVNPGAPGGVPRIEFVPPAAGYPVIMEARTGDGPGFRVTQGAAGRLRITGTGNKSIQVRLPVDNPTLFAAAVLRDRLRSQGVELTGGIRLAQRPGEVPPPSRDQILAVYQSPPMHEMVRHMMKRSDNHFAEQMFVTVGLVRGGRGGYSESRQVEADFLRRLGIPQAGFRGEDGSGLSELNTVTPTAMVALLRAMLSHPAGQYFVDSMAIAGRDGTLRSRMRDSVATDNVRGKTGFINSVSCLSGYLTVPGRANDPIVFALLFNRLQGGPGGARATQDRICEMIIKAYQ